MKLLIDMDVIAYRAGFATSKTKYLLERPLLPSESGFSTQTINMYCDDAHSAKEFLKDVGGVVWSRKESEPEDKALMIADVMIRDIADHYAGATVKGFLTGIGNFRHGIATRANYKGNRAGQEPPVHLKAIRKHLVEKYDAIVSASEEADDLLGIWMTKYPDSVLCSIDKDLMQLPGRHYNFVTKEEVTVSKKEAAINFYTQVLSGDATDQVPGLTGYGPVKARKALEKCNNPAECWQECLDRYCAEFGYEMGPTYALECARLVYVRRIPGEIWSPPSTRQSTVAA